MNQKKNIEIEFRALFDEQKHQELMAFLREHGEDLGEDDKETYFFIFKDKLLKVVKNISKGTGKVVLKFGKIGEKRDWEEIEIPVEIGEVDKIAQLFSALGLPAQLIHNDQKRHNFLYKGVEIAIKFSDDWGCHAELEIVINTRFEREAAEEKIKKLAQELGMKLMTQEEELAFTRKIEEKYRQKES